MKGGKFMDVASLSLAMADMSIRSDVGVKMLSKAMDTNEALGAGLVNMLDAAAMEQSVNPNVGSLMDIRI